MFTGRTHFMHGLIQNANYFTRSHQEILCLGWVSLFRLLLDTPGTFNLIMHNPAVTFHFSVRAMEAAKISLVGTSWPDMDHVSITKTIVDAMSKY